MAVAYFDGASTPNPGMCGCGAILFRDGKVIESTSTPLGYGTNNFAEYMGAFEAVKLCIKNGVRKATIRGDSLLIVNQLNGRWQVKNENLFKIHAKVVKMLSECDCTFEYIPREKNVVADKLSKDAVL